MQVENKPWLLSLLRKLAMRPGAYLGSEDVRALDLFLQAYTQAREDLGLPAFGPGEDALITDFQSWLTQSSGLSDTRGWWGLIERLDSSSTNVRTFLRLFDEFLRTQRNDGDGLKLKP